MGRAASKKRWSMALSERPGRSPSKKTRPSIASKTRWNGPREGCSAKIGCGAWPRHVAGRAHGGDWDLSQFIRGTDRVRPAGAASVSSGRARIGPAIYRHVHRKAIAGPAGNGGPGRRKLEGICAGHHTAQIGYHDSAFTQAQRGVVILRVANAHEVVRRPAECVQRGCKPGGFCHTGGQHHDRAFISLRSTDAMSNARLRPIPL
jgi:hypothetical protein